jgi:hypothetical protein
MIERTRITSKELSDWAAGNRPKSLLKTCWLARPDISIISGASKSKIVYIANLGLLGMPKSYGTYCVQGHKIPMYAMDEVVEWLSKSDVTAKIKDKQKPEKTTPGIDNSMSVLFLSRKRIAS